MMQSRREFLRATGLATVATPYVVSPHLLGRDSQAATPSETVILGVIGTGNRARQLMDQVPPTARIVAIADCYQARMDQTLAEKKTQWRRYRDYRAMFDTEQLDAVIVATPDHGRTLPCVHA